MNSHLYYAEAETYQNRLSKVSVRSRKKYHDSSSRIYIKLIYVWLMFSLLEFSEQCSQGTAEQTYGSMSNDGNCEWVGCGTELTPCRLLEFSYSRMLQIFDWSCIRCVPCASNCACSSPGGCDQGCIGGAFKFNGSCITECPGGTTFNGSTCETITCASNCSCTTQGGCDSCVNGTYSYSEGCVTNCPTGTTLNGSTCEAVTTCADSNCSSCSGPGANECTACSSGFLDGGSCITDCGAGRYGSNGQCHSCNSSCATCSGGGSTDCQSCTNGSQTVVNGSCVDPPPSCGGNQFINGSNQCQDCMSQCATCSNGSSCATCNSPKVLTNNDCVDPVCAGNEYFNGSSCQGCMSQCATCSSGSSCNTCVSGKVMDGTNCVDSCPASKYDQGGICQNCDSSCSTCNGGGNSNCLSCSGSNALESGSCVGTCPSAKVNASNICQPCYSTCATCHGTGSTQCITCVSPLVPSGGGCISSCGTGQYLNSGNCAACDGSCENCDGPSSSHCLSCFSPKVLHSYECLTSCPANFYPLSGVCQACYSSCSECTGANSTDCTACISGKVLSGTQCLDSCPTNSFNNAGECTSCHTTCLTCSGSSSSSCLSCQSPSVLSGGQCLSGCPLNQFDNSGTCTPCHSSCNTCSGASASNCTSCSGGTNLSQGACVGSCPGGTFPSANVCTACDSSCATCSAAGPNSCLTCSGNLALSSNSCLATCPVATYKNVNFCSNCFGGCSSCTGPAQVDCAPCNVPQFKESSSTNCVDQCLSSEYGDTTTRICTPCHGNCLTCTGSTNLLCSSCAGGKFKYQTTQCLDSCPAQTYTQNSECFNCTAGCQTCTSSTACSQCSTTHYAYTNNSVLECHAQSSSCPSDTYSIESPTKACYDCNETCQRCNGGLANNCTECGSPLYLSLNSCVASCPPGTTPVDTPQRICQTANCALNCQTCSGPAVSQCTVCQSGFKMLSDTSECVTTCPSLYFDNGSGVCGRCNALCGSCSGNLISQCQSCLDSTLYWASIDSTCKTENQCTSYGVNYTTVAGPPKICVLQSPNCDTTCLTCSGTAANNCLTCSSPRYLHSSQCLTTCPPGSFPNTGQVCSACEASCATCQNGTNTGCLTCQTNMYLKSGTCVTSCGNNFFGVQTAPWSCSACHGSCLTCIDGSAIGCLSCLTTTYYKADTKECLSSCTPGYTTVETPSKVCELCHSSCSTCNGSLASNCLTCSDSALFLYQGSCVAACPANVAFYSQTTPTKACLACHSSCSLCNGGLINQCTACPANTFLTSTSTCDSSCPLGFFNQVNPNICVNCNTFCSACSGPLNSQCSVCNSPYYYIPDITKCDISCPTPGYVADTVNKLCIKCHATCLNCTGPNSNQCTGCINGRFFKTSTSSCELDCGAQFWNNNSGNVCSVCHTSCLDCFASSYSSCLSCVAPLALRSNNTCKTPCSVGSYPNDSSPTGCSSCNVSCRECTGPTNKDCISCQSTFKITPDKRCVDTCEEGTFESISGVCSNCFSTCRTCNRFGSRACLTCPTNRFYIRSVGSCVEACPDRTFTIGTTECDFCAPHCKKCDDKKVSSCKECLDTAFLHIDTNICHPFCLSGYILRQGTRICEPCHNSCVDCWNTEYDSCRSCKENSKEVIASKLIKGLPVDSFTCEPNKGYYMTSEYSPGIKHGSSTNKPLVISENMVLSNSDQGIIPEFQKIEPFQKCDDSCRSCKGPSKDDCTACYAGKSLNVSKQYKKEIDPFLYGSCDSECEVSKYKQTTLEAGLSPSSPEAFWAIDNGWICKNCHDSCYDCFGPLNTDCRECRYSDSVLQPISARLLESQPLQDEKRQLVSDIGECKKCPKVYQEYPEICDMTSKLSIKKFDRPVDGYSALSFNINIGEKASKYSQRLSDIDWDKILKVEIPGLEEGEDKGYTKRFDFKNGKLYLSLNFTEDGGIQELKVSPLNNTLVSTPNPYNPAIENPEMLLSDEEASVQFARVMQENPETIKKYSGKGGIDFQGLSSVTSTISGFLLVISLLASSGALAGPMLNMIKVFKLVYSLRLINVYFGNILEAFLVALSEGFGSKAKPSNSSLTFFTSTRGKLTVFEIGVLTNEYMHFSYLLILFTRLFGIISAHFKSKIKRAKELSYGHLILVDVLEMFRTSIFYSSVYDIALYSVHELLHHDLTINQTSMARVSYITALIVVILACYELMTSFNLMRKFKLKKLLKGLKMKEKIDKTILEDNADIKTKWKMLLARDKFQKEFNYVFGMSQMFFIAGLELQKCELFVLRAVKLFSVLKIVVFSLLINTLQTLALAQISIILVIQILYTAYIVWASMFRKIFSNIFFALVEILTELSIFSFVLIGAILKYVGRDGMSQKTSTLMQLIAIFLVLFATLLNLVYSIIVLVKGILNIRDLLKFRSTKNQITKKYESQIKQLEETEKKKAKRELIKESKIEPEKLRMNSKSKLPDPQNDSIQKLNESLVLERGRKGSRSNIDLNSQQSKKVTSELGQSSKLKKVALNANPKMNKFIKNQVEQIKKKRREIYDKQQEDLNGLEQVIKTSNYKAFYQQVFTTQNPNNKQHYYFPPVSEDELLQKSALNLTSKERY